MPDVSVSVSVNHLYKIIGAMSIGRDPGQALSDPEQNGDLEAVGQGVVEIVTLGIRSRDLSERLQAIQARLRAGTTVEVVGDAAPGPGADAPTPDAPAPPIDPDTGG